MPGNTRGRIFKKEQSLGKSVNVSQRSFLCIRDSLKKELKSNQNYQFEILLKKNDILCQMSNSIKERITDYRVKSVLFN